MSQVRCFANFGSTEEVPIWEDTSALIHWQIKEPSEPKIEELIEQLLSTCREAGAEVRVSFYDLHYDSDSREDQIGSLPPSLVADWVTGMIHFR